jgi:hypothetical protein
MNLWGTILVLALFAIGYFVFSVWTQRSVAREDESKNWDDELVTNQNQYGRFNDEGTEFWVTCNPNLQPTRYEAIKHLFGQNKRIKDSNTGTDYVATKILPHPYWNMNPYEIPRQGPSIDADHAIRIAVQPLTQAWTGLERLNALTITKAGEDTFRLSPNGVDFQTAFQEVADALDRQTKLSHEDSDKILQTLEWLGGNHEVSRGQLGKIERFLGKYTNSISALSLFTSLIQAAMSV